MVRLYSGPIAFPRESKECENKSLFLSTENKMDFCLALHTKQPQRKVETAFLLIEDIF